MNQSAEINELIGALGKFQAACVVAIATRKNPAFNNSKYANLNDIMEAVMPELLPAGLVVVQFPGFMRAEGAIHAAGLTTRIMHTSGQWIEQVGEFPLAPPASKIVNYSQAYGIAITYARRYALLSALGITTGDDKDAQALSQAVDRPSKEASYTEASHWTDYQGGMWKTQLGSRGALLGDLSPADLKAEMDTNLFVSPPLQACMADHITRLLETNGTSYEDETKPAGRVWPAWENLTAPDLKTLAAWAKSKKPTTQP